MSYSFDALDQLTHARGADGSTAAFSYDGRGNRQTSQVTLRDADPVSMTYSFDALDGLVQISLPDSASVSYAYDPDGRLERVTDALNRTTRYGYDAAGQQTTVTDAGNRTTTTVYDARGRVQASRSRCWAMPRSAPPTAMMR